jgi:6,7-dimethyl-8-ribityllumazine synthase
MSDGGSTESPSGGAAGLAGGRAAHESPAARQTRAEEPTGTEQMSTQDDGAPESANGQEHETETGAGLEAQADAESAGDAAVEAEVGAEAESAGDAEGDTEAGVAAEGAASFADATAEAELDAGAASESGGDLEVAAEAVEGEAAVEAEAAVEGEADVEAEAEALVVEPESQVQPLVAPEWGPELEPAPAVHAPGGLRIPDDVSVLEGEPEGLGRSVGVVVSRFNGEVTDRLLESALEELDRAGVARDRITVMPVPGAFELPLGAMALAKTRRFACVVALGCVIRGETAHFDYVAGEAASGLQLAGLETGVPVAFGVLTVDTREQAEARVGRGGDAARSALEMASIFHQLRAQAMSG